MAYKAGTYKLNLGIDKDLKEILQDICLGQNINKLADGVRFCINYTYQSLNHEVKPEDIATQLALLRMDLEKVREAMRK